MKQSKYDQDPGKRDRMIAKGQSHCCSRCQESKTIDQYYWQKAHNNPAARCKDCWKELQRERWANDTEFRDRHQSYVDSWNDRGGREHVNEYRRERWANDAEYKAKQKASGKRWAMKKKNEKNEKK